MKFHELFKRANKINSVLKELPGVENRKEARVFPSIDEILHDAELKQVSGKLFKDGYHARAVEEAFKFLNNLVKKKAKLDLSLDGAKLLLTFHNVQ